jgi:putative NADH-flavin reductase
VSTESNDERGNAARLLILGATGALGSKVLRLAVEAGHKVTVVVRSPSRLPAEFERSISIHIADLQDGIPASAVRDQDAVINCAGHVADGERFVGLVDRIVASVEELPAAAQPVCWFLAGAALLDLDETGRRGVDLPAIARTYWPHRANFDRLTRSPLDWRLLCPGPMLDVEGVGSAGLRVSIDQLPVDPPSPAPGVSEPPGLAAFAALVPSLVVPYADAAMLMLANLDRGNRMSRHRVGLAVRRSH